MPDYSNLIMVEPDGTYSRGEVIPSVYGFPIDYLDNFDWMGPPDVQIQYGLYGQIWLPAELVEQEVPRGMKWGKEIYELVRERGVVRLSHEIVPFTAEDIAEQLSNQRAKLISEFNRALARLSEIWPIQGTTAWWRQANEAREYLAAPADAKPQTRFLSAVRQSLEASGATFELEAVAQLVVDQDDNYGGIYASVLAVRLVAEKQLATAEIPDEIHWQFPDLSAA